MEKVYDYYRKKVQTHTLLRETLRKKIHRAGSVRLVLFAGLIAFVWFFKAEDILVLAGVVTLFVLLFIILMVYHTKLSNRKAYVDAIILLCEQELKGLDGDFEVFDGAPEQVSAEHAFGLDLDLFGDRSLFQSINRSATKIGRQELIDWFSNPLIDPTEIIRRQEAIREIGEQPELRHYFYVTGKIKKGSVNDPDKLDSLASSEIYFATKKRWVFMVYAIPSVWVVLITLSAIGLLPWSMPGAFFPLSFFLAYMQSKRINRVLGSVNKMERIFSTYATLIKCVEDACFKAPALSAINRRLTGKAVRASVSIKLLSRHIGALDQRFSAMGIILNIFMLRDMRNVMKIERWQQRWGNDIKGWFDALAKFDAYSSLGTFAFNHPDYIYPTFSASYFFMEGKALGHPLLSRKTCVRNDISITQNPQFLIVTGANMAGKSTYLRTIGVNYLLSCVGTPVCAKELTVFPTPMITSLRTADSLMHSESYFFAELKRLKMIINRLQSGEKLFIILDEILKGTNSVDKQKGSLALVRQLVSYRSCGIIATHDLALGDLEKEFPGSQIKNYRFEADMAEDNLIFNYRLREGIAQNMNACFLMRKMGITI